MRRVPQGQFTGWIFDQLQEKTILRIQAPLDTFTLREESDQPLLLIGGNTGFAPLKGMIEQTFHVGVERPIYLYREVRSRRALYLPELPRDWARAHAKRRYTPVLSQPDPDWTERIGLIHAAVAADHPDLRGFDVYLNGLPVMVEAGRRAFADEGLPPEHLFSDAFEYAADAPAKPGD